MFKHEVVREVLSAILIIAILYFGIQGTTFIIMRTDSPMMAVVSNSMYPTFERGDLIFVKGVDSPDEIKRGDIIVFQLDGDPETKVHRVVEIENNDGQLRFRTKGDHNPNIDPWNVSFEEVKGRVLFWIPKLGYLSLWIRGE
jgi:signal peptidase